MCFDIKMEQLFLQNDFSLVLDLFSDFLSWILKGKKLLKYDKLIDHNDLIVCDVFLRKNKTKSKNLC